MSQPTPSKPKSALIGAAVVAASAGAGALAGYLSQKDSYRGLSTMGGAFTGASAAGIGGAIVALVSKDPRWKRPATAAAVLGIGGVLGSIIFAGVMSKSLPGPAPVPQVPPPGPGSIPWVAIPVTSTLRAQTAYRLSDVATAYELKNPPSLTTVQTSMAQSGLEVDGVWTGSPPTGWVPQDPAGGRVYVEFSATKNGLVLPAGLTAAAHLYVQQASA